MKGKRRAPARLWGAVRRLARRTFRPTTEPSPGDWPALGDMTRQLSLWRLDEVAQRTIRRLGNAGVCTIGDLLAPVTDRQRRAIGRLSQGTRRRIGLALSRLDGTLQHDEWPALPHDPRPGTPGREDGTTEQDRSTDA